MKSNTVALQERFFALAAKYDVSVPESWCLGFHAPQHGEDVGGWWLDVGSQEEFIPLFPWRCERRFFELLRIVETKTLEDVVLARFSRTTDGTTTNLRQILYREFDLLEWILGSPIVSVSGCVHADKFANVLVRLESGAIASVEAGTTLPAGRPPLDRHELIARRGVASDRVVDTHVPQESIYLFDENGVRCWTDTDAELFGLEADEIAAVRAAFETAKTPESAGANRSRHHRLLELVDRTLRS